MPTNRSHCRLCAEPFARSRLVCLDDDEVIDIEQNMLLINIDVSTPSPLPRDVCYSCLSLLERTCSFLHQVSAAQDKLSLIYQDNKDLVGESHNMDVDLDFGVKEEPLDEEKIDIKIKPCLDGLPVKTGPATTKVLDNITVKNKRRRQKKVTGTNEAHNFEIIEIEELLDSKTGQKRNNENKKYIKKVQIERLPNIQYNILSRNESHACHVCGKLFKSKGRVRVHLKIHNELKPYICDVCGKGYNFKCRLVSHMSLHTGERPFNCDKCDMTFRLKRQFVLHRTVHTGERPYVCNFCSKTFRLKTIYQAHVRLHTDVKLYCCEFCGKEYMHKANYYKHVRTTHGAERTRNKELEQARNEKENTLDDAHHSLVGGAENKNVES